MTFNRHYVIIPKMSTSANRILEALGPGNSNEVAARSDTHNVAEQNVLCIMPSRQAMQWADDIIAPYRAFEGFSKGDMPYCSSKCAAEPELLQKLP